MNHTQARRGSIPACGRWWGDLGALVVGLLLPAAFAPYSLFPLPLILLAALFVLWSDVAPRRVFWRGYLFGIGYFALGVYWIYISIARYGNAPLPVAIGVTAVFVAVLALFPGFSGYAVRRWLPAGRAWLWVVLFPAAWVLAEWIRGWLFTGFPWLQIGYSQVASPLSGLAPVTGVLGVSWALAISAGLVAMALAGSLQARWLGLVGLVGLWAGAWALGSVGWTTPSGDPIRVSLIQGNIPQSQKWQSDQREPTLRLYRRLTERQWASDGIIWPETAVPTFYHKVASSYLRPLERAAREHDTSLLLGVPVWDFDTARYFNSVLSLGGGERQFYHKSHLVPFGEYIPFKDQLGSIFDVLRLPMSDFSAGDERQPLLRLAGYPVGVSICYEDAFGSEIINQLPEAAFLVNVSNDAWFGDSVAPHQHLEIARMRALESGRFLLRATNTGISAVIDARGRIRASAPQFQVDVLTDAAEPRQGATPYVRVGNGPLIGLLVAMLAVGGWAGQRGLAGSRVG